MVLLGTTLLLAKGTTARRRSLHMGSMEMPFKSEPFFIVRFWVPRGDSSRDGHVTLAQQDGTYIGGYWDAGVFHWSQSLQADITRTGYSPTLTLKLFYKDHLPDFGAIKVWLKNALLSETSDPDVTCSSLIYHVLLKGGATCGDVDPARVTPAVLREIIFDMIRKQTKDY